MSRRLIACLVLIGLSGQALGQDALQIKKGRLRSVGDFGIQVVSVQNDTGRDLRAVAVECGFYRQTELIAAEIKYIENLRANALGHGEVLAAGAAGTDRTECRVVSSR